jgi:hypothetical protein
METGMRALALSALVLGWIVAGASASATVYVPGKFHNGVYTRPHFLDYPGQTVGGPLLLPPDDTAEKGKEEAPGRILLEPDTMPPKHQPLPAS